MQQNAKFIRKLPIPMDIKKEFPVTEEVAKVREARVEEMRAILDGRDSRLMLLIGPCSADREDSVMDYVCRLVPLQEKVKDKILIVPRIYTNKPRTNGSGYKGMLHQPDPSKKPDMLEGIIAIRRLHTRAVQETGFACADEMLYPENYRYLSDILGYVAVGARSVENQQHRLVASGIDVPVGMKNPTGGDLSVMMNSIYAAMGDHTFLYRGWEVETAGNPYAHAIMRGYVNEKGDSRPNYHYEDLVQLHKRGRMLVASYEAIRFQRLDLFSVTLRQIGAYIGRMHLEDAIEVLRNGDGNQNAAQQYTIGTKPITGTKGTLTYDALLEFWSQFDPYTMNTMLVGSDVMLAMLKLDEFQNPLTGLNFQGTGTLTTPLGAKLLRTSAMPAGILIGLDRNYALEQICGSEITVEYDKLIDRQLERAAITSVSGFAKLFTDAAKVLKV